MSYMELSADDPAYWAMMAQVEAGNVRIIGDMYDKDGYLTTAFEEASGFRGNPSIKIGGNFFQSAIRDYYDWPIKWWREAIQNSVDAGATRIECGSVTRKDGNKRVWVQDNGHGMDRETILNKFLVLGETGKASQEGAVGGFGKAKELLILPWNSWSIQSMDTIVLGSGIEYEIDEVPHMSGTRLEVVMPSSNYTTISKAFNFISKCHLPKVRFLLAEDTPGAPPGSSHSIKFDPDQYTQAGRVVKELGGATLYFTKGRQKSEGSSLMIIRSKGVMMYTDWLPSGVDENLVLELTGRSVDLLTANRDGLRDYKLRRELNDFLSWLAKDIRTALSGKSGVIKKKFKGRGKFSTARQSQFREALLEMLSKKGVSYPTENVKGHKADNIYMSEKQVGGFVEIAREDEMEAEIQNQEDPEPPAISLKSTYEIAGIIASGMIKGPEQIDVIVKQLTWEPDFFIFNEQPGYIVQKRFFPEFMTPQVVKIARLWTELCRFILIQLKETRSFGVGFTFSHDANGMFLHEEGENWLLLNPFAIKEKGEEMKNLYKITSRDDVSLMYATAVHECTHFHDMLSYHDEAFSSALTRNFAKTSRRDKQINAIIRSLRKLPTKPGV